MRRAVILLGVVLCAVAIIPSPGLAQQAPPGAEMGRGFFRFMGAGRFWAATVTGAPMSAQAVTETTRTLTNGNVIDRKETALIYRDSDGRLRIDRTLRMIGPLMSSGAPPEIITIHDPVAGVTYILNPSKKVAYEIPVRPSGNQAFQRWRSRGHANRQTSTQPLGVKTINGVQAKGTQTTRIIAAGRIGNAQPITIVSQRWYSPDLQMDVMTTTNDPRFGVTTYQLTNIQTSEPAAALFQVPSGYTVHEGRSMRRRNAGAPQ
ncbi:MAG: hypothetical protein ACRD3D_12110 [Terriglobia bacterium]